MSFSCAYRHGKYLAAMLLATCYFAPFTTLGQSSGGQISGTVVALNGPPVLGAQVVLYSDSTGAEERRTETDMAGKYMFSGLPLGAYKLSASASGFRDSQAKMVILRSASATADLELAPVGPRSEGSNNGRASQKSPPAFSPTGVRGTIAPSGYSSGLSSEETAHVRASASALEPMIFSTLIRGIPPDCSQESVLLHDIEKAPHEFAPNHALGAFYLSHGDYAKGTQYLAAARSIVPADFTNSRDLAVAMIGAGHSADAVALLERLTLEHESDSTLLRLLAFAYRSAGENEKSVAAFQKAAASDAGVENQYDCGVGFIQLSALREALDLFTRGTKTHPESAHLWLGLGITEHLLDHKEVAVAALLRSADADPDFLPPLAVLAELFNLADQTKADLRRRIAGYLVGHPEDAEAHVAYALILSKQAQSNEDGVRQEITSQLKRALQLNPGMARAHFLLGDIEAEVNNLPGAIDEFVEGLKLEPANAQAHYRLALLYRRNSQQDAGRKEMDAFLVLRGKPDNENSSDAVGTFSVTMPSIQLIPAQRACNLKPD